METTTEHIHSQYFLNEKLAGHLLNGVITSVYLVHMYDREEYTKEELLDAYDQQRELVQKYKDEFTANHDVYGLEENGQLASFNNDEYVNELVDYIIDQETK